jgi:histidinol phosphatase-like PHP family hydrolase
MVNCWILGGKDDAGGPFTLGDDFFGRGQANEACAQEIIFLDLLGGHDIEKEKKRKE